MKKLNFLASAVLVSLGLLGLQAQSLHASDEMLISIIQPDGVKVAKMVSLGQPLSKLREDLVSRNANILPGDKFLVPKLGELSPRDEANVEVSKAIDGRVLSFKPRGSSSSGSNLSPDIDTASDESKKIRGFIESSLIEQVFPPIKRRVINTKSQAPTRLRPQKGSLPLEIKGRPVRENSITKEHVFKKIIPGKDGRIQVKQTDVWPNSAHGLVSSIFYYEDNKGVRKELLYLGTGTLIASNLVLTAAHNLYEKETRYGKVVGAVKKVKFYPAINRNQTVFGEQTVREFYYPPEFRDSNDDEEDYGLMVLENPVGEMTGYFGLSVLPPDQIKGLTINVTGYPADKVEKKKYQYEMWGMEGSPKEINQNFITYEIDTYSGQSGSGVWYRKADDYFVVGIHVLGDPVLGRNKATLLTKARYETIRKWVAESIRKLIRDKSTKGMLSSAVPIDFRGKRIGDDGVGILCREYSHCLHSLDLSRNGITDKGAEALAANTTLVTLNLSSNEIGDSGAVALGETLKTNITLTSLDLDNNQIGVPGSIALAETLKINTTLMNLGLGCRIGSSGAVALAEALKINTTLTSLGLGSNRIGDFVVEALVEALKTNTTLTSLDLGGNKIGISGTKTLGKTLRTNNTLTHLDLSLNQIGNEGAKCLWRALEVNKTLTKLNLSDNNMGRVDDKDCEGGPKANVKALAKLLKVNQTLTHLDLSGNQLGHECDGKILGKALKVNQTLRSLDLSCNAIYTEDLSYLFEALDVNTTLTSLNLSENDGIDQEEEEAIYEILASRN
jgi:V8-like Glu-specific endopeptidase/Ran GTPase-activating protein (RanGAP) involved in mRNA processing and transport